MLSFILGTIIVFYFLSIIGRFLLRYFITKKFKQFSEGGANWQNFGGFQNTTNNQNTTPHHEGEVVITKTTDNSKKVRDKVGEYVDFEEIK
ncbi:MAG: DUF4834 family protein [Rikenellaceae bacterium]